MSYGQVANCPDHNYRSYKFEAGARFGKSINLRYSVGKQNWAQLDNKQVNTKQQFTIGLLTSSLFKDGSGNKPGNSGNAYGKEKNSER